MPLSGDAARFGLRILLYLALALGGLIVIGLATVVSARTGISPSGGWFGFVGFTPFVFWAVIKAQKRHWRRRGLWVAVGALLLLHLAVFITILLKYPALRLVWFAPLSIIEIALFSVVLVKLFDQHGPQFSLCAPNPPLGRAMRHRAVSLAAIALAGLFVVGLVGSLQSAQKRGGIVLVSFKYKPVEVRSLDDLPPDIVAAVTAHLQQRLGAGFLAQLSFTGGQAVDVEKLYREDPSARELKWQVFSYRLLYSFSLPQKGIQIYEAGICLDRNGKVIREIDLPAVATHPSKGTFVSLARALEVAGTRGFEPTRVDLEYRPKEDIITYRLSRRDATFRVYFLDIDAHTGDAVEEWSVQGDP